MRALMLVVGFLTISVGVTQASLQTLLAGPAVPSDLGAPGESRSPDTFEVVPLPATPPRVRSLPGGEVVQWDAAVRGIEATVGRAIVDAKFSVSPSARDAIVREVLRYSAIRERSPEDIAKSQSEVSEVMGLLSTTKKSEWGSPTEIENALANAKLAKIVETLPVDISTAARDSGIVILPSAYERLYVDLRAQSAGLARSGFATADIKRRNFEYMATVYGAAPGRQLDDGTYRQLRAAFFPQIARLTIISEPLGAEVDVHGVNIGKTRIERKPLEANKEYVFTFRLPNYKVSRRVYYLQAGQTEHTLREVLLPEERK